MHRSENRETWNANAEAWTTLSRAGFDVYRDLVNTPAFFAILPDVKGRVCLDLGCGEGHNTRMLAGRGARVVGLDISDVFVQAAAAAGGDVSGYTVADAGDLPFGAATFDAVTAFMSLMDVPDPDRTLREISRVLKPGGFVQFSVVHPATSTPVRRWVSDDAGEREALAVGGYFIEGPQTEKWIFKRAQEELRDRFTPFTIISARRTVSSWINAVVSAGLVIEGAAEPCADLSTADAHPEVADTRIVPFFFHIRARRA
jgi:ubiquinone/menaquinone biosynthesis C-methylase UbiE